MEKIEPISSRRVSANIPEIIGTKVVSGLPGNANPVSKPFFLQCCVFLLQETIRGVAGSFRKIMFGISSMNRRIKYGNNFELISSGSKV